MPTTARTTIKQTLAGLLGDMDAHLVADPPLSSRPLRSVIGGKPGDTAFPRPFVSVYLLQAEIAGAADDDKMISVTMGMRLCADADGADPHDSLLEIIGRIDNYFDSLRDDGLLNGAAGFDDRSWKFDYPRITAGARVVAAIATQTFAVRVRREESQ